MQSKRFDTVIVGGGIGGLVAAVLLAEKGRSVAVFEQSKHWGGRGLTHERSGCKFNLGPHAIYWGFSAETTLKELGIQLEGKAPTTDHNGRLLYKDNLYILPGTPRAVLTTKLLTAGEKVGQLGAIAKILSAKPDKLQEISWAEWSREKISNDKIRAILTTIGRVSTYANYPERIRAGVMIRQLQAVLSAGVLYLDEGWQQIVDSLLVKAQAKGVSLHLNCGVTEVVQGEDGYTVRLRDGETVSAESIIAATPPAVAARLLDSEVLRSEIAGQMPVKAACLTLALSKLSNPEKNVAFGVDTPLYYSLHSTTAKLAPDGVAVIHLARYLDDEKRDAKEVRAELEAFLDKLQPGWRDQVLDSEYLPSITVYHALPAVGRPRPAVAVADRPNAYVIGDWVDVDDILLDASITSAKLAVAGIMKLKSPERVGV